MGRTFYTIIQDNARARGSEKALIGSSVSLTHSQLLERVDRLAEGLNQRGIASGDRVCLLAHNTIESFLLFGACARTGAIVFPINWRLSGAEVQAVLALAEPKMLVVDAANLGALESIEVEDIPLRVVFGIEPEEGWLPFEDLSQDVKGEFPGGKGEDAFVLLTTAAVEGMPRAATLTHANILSASDQLITGLELTPDDRHLAALPLFHVTGLGLSMATLQAGGANVIQERFDPTEAVGLMDEHQVSLLASFPPVLATLLEAREATDANWDSLRYVLGLDAPEMIQRLLMESGASFWTGFGQSETSGVVTLVDVREKPGAVGKPLPAVELRCFDEQGAEVPVGAPGEIVVRGPLVFQGYWRDDDANMYASRHGWHHTGDVGRFDEEGYLYYLGRKPEKDLIKSGGENIYPAEVEFAIESLPQVYAVCVIGVPDETWGETVKAVIELKPGETLTDKEVIETVTARIADFKKPRQIQFVEALPRTSEGQIDRAAVKSTYVE
ncbi:MAG: AMP-binding protein [Anaerolineales bacterium]|nr:AMP-binding protein [Anaerolineales bacterium]